MGADVVRGFSPILVGYLAIGLGLGLAYFSLMWRSVRAFTGGASGGFSVVAMIMRFALLAGVLFLTSRAGAWPLLATAVGVVAGRQLVLRRVGRATPA
jgi:hypothetical protein